MTADNKATRSNYFSTPLNLNASVLIIKLLQLKMNPNQREEHRKRKDEAKLEQSHSNSSDDDEEGDENDHYESDFIVDDQDESNGYEMPYRGGYSDDDSKEKKSKKHKKREKKKKKEKKRKEQEQSYDEDDLDLIDNDQKLTRLKKKKEPRRESDEDEDPDLYDMRDDDNPSELDNRSDDEDNYRNAADESESESALNEIMVQHKDIFDPSDLKRLTIEEEDRDVAELDLPERYINQLKTYARNSRKTIAQVREELELEDKNHEADWIYHKIKILELLQSYDEKQCKDKIKKVLQLIHRDHLDIMYIFFYRKKMYSDVLSLEVLWKIHEFDEEWYTFREKQKKEIDLLQIILPSYTEVPKELVEFAYQCPQLRTLKYFEDFSLFAEAKWMIQSQNSAALTSKRAAKKLSQLNFITQIAERGVAHELQNSQIFLSPKDLCFNIKMRNQERKPRTPNTDPKGEFERIMRQTGNGEDDNVKYPLLTTEKSRFKTITKYLCYELYSYPELRRLLKEKYYKKLLISTQPTKKGLQDIDLYSMYFPVKRIKDKPVSTLKRQAWILAQNAKKLNLITIDLRFEWELPSAEKNDRQLKERDTVYLQLAKSYFQISYKSSQIWNIFRKKILQGLLNDHFLPTFQNEIKQDLTREGQIQIINICCQKLKQQLNKGPSLKEGKPIKILSMVLEDTKLGIAFVDESGKAQFTFHMVITNDEELRRFVCDENLSVYIREYKPDMILIAANCKRAQTLRKELRDPKLFPQSIFCAFGEYEVPRLVAKKQIIKGQIEQESVLQAISMARLKKNPMSEIISLWAEKVSENGILSMNLHQYQSFINQRKLKDNLEKVIIQVVNMVGLDINEVNKNEHLQNQLEFISGLGPKKSFLLLQKLKEERTEILSRRRIDETMKSKIVSWNCTPFLKIETSFHKILFQKLQKQKKGQPSVKEYEEICLLDMTRIPEEWYPFIMKKMSENNKTVTTLNEMRSKKQFSKLSDENLILLDIFKNPEKIRGIEWKFKENIFFDDEVVKSEIMSRFRNPRDPERVMENRQIFFNLLRQTPETLKRYMIMQVRVLSIKKNYLNVIIPENGLFGYMKLQGKTPEELDKYEKMYEKGTTIKAVIIGFPFDEKTYRDQTSEEQELLKIEMALDFPHKDNDRHDGSRHDCMITCFPAIVKEIHPLIDLEKDRFDLKKEDRPIIEVKEDKVTYKNIKADFRRISHPKFKNISAVPAIDMMKESQIGDFIIRPSSQGPEYLTITWNFFKGVIVHIKIRCEHKGMNSMNMTYRIEDKDNRSYNSLQEIIQKCIKPMNILVQDITSNKKFLNISLEQIENQVKRETQSDNSHIYYYFGVSEDYPQYVLLMYMYKDKKPIRQLIKIKSSGFYFHEQQFSNTRDLIAWFKEHLKEKEYQKYVKTATQMIQRLK